MAKHQWIRDEDGKIDIFRLDADYHNGPECAACGEMYCHHCVDIDQLDDCEGIVVVQERREEKHDE